MARGSEIRADRAGRAGLWNRNLRRGSSLALLGAARARSGERGRVRNLRIGVLRESGRATARGAAGRHRGGTRAAGTLAGVVSLPALAAGYVRGRCLLRFVPSAVPAAVLPPGARAALADPVNRVTPLLLIAAGLLACALAAFDVGGGLRLAATATFLLLGPGWAIAGFVRRPGRALQWLLAIAAGVSLSILVGQGMAMLHAWAPVVALYVATGLCLPLLLRHAVVAHR